MASHNVSFVIPQKFVLAQDVKFEVKSNGQKLGELLISKGNVEWIPRKNSANKCRMSWERFAALMESEGNAARIKK